MAVFKAYKLEIFVMDDVYLTKAAIREVTKKAMDNYAEVVHCKVVVTEEHECDGKIEEGVQADA